MYGRKLTAIKLGSMEIIDEEFDKRDRNELKVEEKKLEGELKNIL